MAETPWELKLVDALGPEAWDEGTELVSTVADELPLLLDAGARSDLALGIILLLVTDLDLVQMVNNLFHIFRKRADDPHAATSLGSGRWPPRP